jgi:hypothetical protein
VVDRKENRAIQPFRFGPLGKLNHVAKESAQSHKGTHPVLQLGEMPRHSLEALQTAQPLQMLTLEKSFQSDRQHIECHLAKKQGHRPHRGQKQKTRVTHRHRHNTQRPQTDSKHAVVHLEKMPEK